MIYLDSSVALAQLLSEPVRPSPEIWRNPLFSSRLLEFEVRVRINIKGNNPNLHALADALFENVVMLEVEPEVVRRLNAPFPIHVRTLDAIHLATMDFIRSHEPSLTLASYDKRLLATAAAIGVPAFEGMT